MQIDRNHRFGRIWNYVLFEVKQNRSLFVFASATCICICVLSSCSHENNKVAIGTNGTAAKKLQIQNNTWRRLPPKGSTTNIVFVHGIFSSSQTCWESASKKAFWPDLIAKDATFKDCGVFVAGYHTAFGSGDFDMINAVKQLNINFYDQKNQGVPSPLEAKELVFIAHSTGGILIREYLTRHSGEFRNKKIGLILLASPALGSRYADWLGIVATAYGNKMADQLKKTNPNLENLDERFRELLDQVPVDRGFCLQGVEYLEAHFISTKAELAFKMKQIVTQKDVGRYFGPANIVPETDHFSIAAPEDDHAEAYKYVRTWFSKTYKRTECNELEDHPTPSPIPMRNVNFKVEEKVEQTSATSATNSKLELKSFKLNLQYPPSQEPTTIEGQNGMCSARLPSSLKTIDKVTVEATCVSPAPILGVPIQDKDPVIVPFIRIQKPIPPPLPPGSDPRVEDYFEKDDLPTPEQLAATPVIRAPGTVVLNYDNQTDSYLSIWLHNCGNTRADAWTVLRADPCLGNPPYNGFREPSGWNVILVRMPDGRFIAYPKAVDFYKNDEFTLHIKNDNGNIQITLK